MNRANRAKVFFTVLCFVVCGCTPSKQDLPLPAKQPEKLEGPAVTIIAKPLYLQKRTLVRPQEARNHIAYTEWFFHCYPQFEYKLVANTPTSNGIKATIVVKKVVLTISLPITIRMPAKIKAEDVEHEQGHLQICTDVYKKGEEMARIAAESVIDKKFVGQADTISGATTVAVNQATMQIGEIYRHGTVDEVNFVSASYDKLTEAGTPIQAAIRQSFALYLKSKQVK